MKSSYLFKHNVEALLRARGQTKHDLAQWCRRSDAWLSKILGKDDRNLPLKYLDRIADFFGLAAYQLFQPGITPLTERRRTERRSGRDRRIGAAVLSGEAISPGDLALVRQFNDLKVDERRKVESWIVGTLLGRATAPGQAHQNVPGVAGEPPSGQSRRIRGK